MMLTRNYIEETSDICYVKHQNNTSLIFSVQLCQHVQHQPCMLQRMLIVVKPSTSINSVSEFMELKMIKHW